MAVSAGNRLVELTSLKDLYDGRLVLLGMPGVSVLVLPINSATEVAVHD